MVHACVFRTCAASTEREEAGWNIRGRKGRRRVGGEEEEEEEEASSPPIQRRTWTWKEAKIDLPAAYLADTRFIRSSCYFPPLPLLSSPLLLYPLPPGMYTWTVRFSTGGEEEEGIEGMEVSWKKGAGIIRCKATPEGTLKRKQISAWWFLLSEEERFEYFSMVLVLVLLVFFLLGGGGSMRKVKRNFWYL